MASIGSGSIFNQNPFDASAIEAQIATLFTFVGRLSAAQVDLPVIGPAASETVQLGPPVPPLLDSSYTFVPWIASLGTPQQAGELEITAIAQVDDATWDVEVTNNGAAPSAATMKVVALFIDSP